MGLPPRRNDIVFILVFALVSVLCVNLLVFGRRYVYNLAVNT